MAYVSCDEGVEQPNLIGAEPCEYFIAQYFIKASLTCTHCRTVISLHFF